MPWLLLGRFLFRYDQMRQPVGTLSGGERTRLQLCLLMLSGANCLLLDEPTNHLDIESMEVLGVGARVLRRHRDRDQPRPLPAGPDPRPDRRGPRRPGVLLATAATTTGPTARRRRARDRPPRAGRSGSSRRSNATSWRAGRVPDWWPGASRAAREKVARFADQAVLGAAGAGVRRSGGAACMILGLAPAAHGGNRTGRIFTGDRSGDFLYASLYPHRASRTSPTSVARDDGLRPARSVRHRREPMRAAREQAHARRSATRACRSSSARSRRSAGSAWSWRSGRSPGTGRCERSRPTARPCPRPKPRFGHGAEATVGPVHPARLLPPEPAEHVHGQAHRADDGRDLRASGGASARALSRP